MTVMIMTKCSVFETDWNTSVQMQHVSKLIEDGTMSRNACLSQEALLHIRRQTLCGKIKITMCYRKFWLCTWRYCKSLASVGWNPAQKMGMYELFAESWDRINMDQPFIETRLLLLRSQQKRLLVMSKSWKTSLESTTDHWIEERWTVG